MSGLGNLRGKISSDNRLITELTTKLKNTVSTKENLLSTFKKLEEFKKDNNLIGELSDILEQERVSERGDLVDIFDTLNSNEEKKISNAKNTLDKLLKRLYKKSPDDIPEASKNLDMESLFNDMNKIEIEVDSLANQEEIEGDGREDSKGVKVSSTLQDAKENMKKLEEAKKDTELLKKVKKKK